MSSENLSGKLNKQEVIVEVRKIMEKISADVPYKIRRALSYITLQDGIIGVNDRGS